jgi:NitT/TauT family transport system ATP-binding protein
MSGRPGRVKEIILVNLARPRSLSIKDEPDFVHMRRHIWDLLEKEVQRQVGGKEMKA